MDIWDEVVQEFNNEIQKLRIHLGNGTAEDYAHYRQVVGSIQSLEWAKRVVLDPLKKYKVYLTIGNHDCYYKNTNNVNSPELLLRNYPNIKIYTKATEVKFDKLNVLFLPWIKDYLK